MLRTRRTDPDGVAGDQLELNMTPMIDIVFQLIVFFLLSLKFKDVDRRIDTMMPKDRGEDIKPVFLPDDDRIKVKVFRRNLQDPRRTHTLVKVDNAARFKLPDGWKGRRKESRRRVAEYDRVLAAVRGLVENRIATYGGIPSAVKGEIKAPPPRGGAVPHGDVVALVDLFLQVGMTDVQFEGQMRPLTRRERAARNAERGLR
jgi:biopolymer transport protein ExbD